MANVMEITVGYKCNCNCKFCSIAHMRKEAVLSTEQIKQKIRQAKKQKIPNVGFGGGEPTIRKDIFEVVRYAKKLGFDVIRIQTNGVMLAYESFVEKILDAGATFFKISIHGHNARIHDYLTQLPGSFDMIIKGIKNLKKREMSVEVNIVINKLNYKYLAQITDFFVKMKVYKFCFIYPVFEGNMIDNFKEMGVKLSKVAPYLTDALDMVNELDLDKGICMNVPPCILSSDPDMKYGYVYKYDTLVSTPDSTSNIDQSNKDSLVKPSICEKCVFNNTCIGLLKSYAKHFGTDELDPVLKKE